MSKSEVKSLYYYYLRDEQNRPLVTVCLAINRDTNEFFRGITICGSDNLEKSEGRKYASRRVLRAIKRRKNTMSIKQDFVIGILNEVGYKLGMYKSMYGDDLSGLDAMERRLIKV